MSHEMRTPLNGVLGIAEVLARLVQDPEQKRMIKLMHDSGSLLLNIINDLLDMSKIEADQLSIEAVPFDMLELANRLEAVHTLGRPKSTCPSVSPCREWSM
jgi:signal transduction histidine kinase